MSYLQPISVQETSDSDPFNLPSNFLGETWEALLLPDNQSVHDTQSTPFQTTLDPQTEVIEYIIRVTVDQCMALLNQFDAAPSTVARPIALVNNNAGQLSDPSDFLDTISSGAQTEVPGPSIVFPRDYLESEFNWVSQLSISMNRLSVLEACRRAKEGLRSLLRSSRPISNDFSLMIDIATALEGDRDRLIRGFQAQNMVQEPVPSYDPPLPVRQGVSDLYSPANWFTDVINTDTENDSHADSESWESFSSSIFLSQLLCGDTAAASSAALEDETDQVGENVAQPVCIAGGSNTQTSVDDELNRLFPTEFWYSDAYTDEELDAMYGPSIM